MSEVNEPIELKEEDLGLVSGGEFSGSGVSFVLNGVPFEIGQIGLVGTPPGGFNFHIEFNN